MDTSQTYLEKRRKISVCNLDDEYEYILKFVSTITKPCTDKKKKKKRVQNTIADKIHII